MRFPTALSEIFRQLYSLEICLHEKKGDYFEKLRKRLLSEVRDFRLFVRFKMPSSVISRQLESSLKTIISKVFYNSKLNLMLVIEFKDSKLFPRVVSPSSDI